MLKRGRYLAGKLADAYAQAGGVASESLSSLRTIAALTAEATQTSKYGAHLDDAKAVGIKRSTQLGRCILFMNSSGA